MSDYLQIQLAGLAFRAVPGANSAVRLRAATWHNLLHRLGVHLPYVIVHDLGQIFCYNASETGQIGLDEAALQNAGTHPDFKRMVGDYVQLVDRLSQSEVVHRARGWRLGDDVIAVLLAKVLMVVFRDWPEARKKAYLREQMPMDADEYEYTYLRHNLGDDDWQYFYRFFNTLLQRSLQVRHAVEQIDLDTLRLLAMFGGTEFGHNPLELVDLMGLFTMPMVNDIVNFSLQIIPSVLETKQLKDAQTYSMDGFSGIERLGNLDNLILTEFAYDEDIFLQKFADNELYYYGRERAREEEKKIHYLLVDASASMRGRRTVFARGVALAMIKKLILQKEQPIFRFFDSRLYESVRVGVDAHSVPYLLSFKSERGRNYRKVFEQILFECRRLRERERQEIILYFFTHGQCHLPDDLIMRLRELVYLFGIYILPGERLELNYVSHLNKYQVVREESLGNTQQRAGAARNILSQVGR
ncbi:MAG: hypothetical protein AAFS10_15255 [Myxococcota bacterium]